MAELPLCKCGCGLRIERITKKYFGDHYRNPPEKKVEIIDGTVIEAEPEEILMPIKAEKGPDKPIKKFQPKAKTKPIPGGKISKQNLLNVGLGIYTC